MLFAFSLLVNVAAAFTVPGHAASLPRVKMAEAAAATARRSIPLVIRGVPDSGGACVLLPFEDFGGECPPAVGGEIMLQELEDEEESNTQLFLNADGTVGLGATDGPPPLDVCGLWQCGAASFQMTLVRTFTNSQELVPPEPDPQAYSVTRVYVGTVDPDSSGVKAVEGRIELFDENGEVPPPPGAIGYFVIDANTAESDEAM
jgi:hypothetical protein